MRKNTVVYKPETIRFDTNNFIAGQWNKQNKFVDRMLVHKKKRIREKYIKREFNKRMTHSKLVKTDLYKIIGELSERPFVNNNGSLLLDIGDVIILDTPNSKM